LHFNHRIHQFNENINSNCEILCFLESVSRTFEGVFEGKKKILEKKLDTEHGLLDELEAKKVITSRHRTAVEVMFV